ncbi:MAG: TrmH family RNA methyltransferase [Bdellovibrionota bacterium]
MNDKSGPPHRRDRPPRPRRPSGHNSQPDPTVKREVPGSRPGPGPERLNRFEKPMRGMFRSNAPARSAPPRRSEGSPHLGKNEIRFYGKNACIAIWKNRPKDIIRVYVMRELSEEFAELLTGLAKEKREYQLVGEGDLERLTDSVHHQGICIVAMAKRTLEEKDLFREINSNRMLVLYLDGVGNPHNLGAILRTAAHFGVRYVAIPKDSFSRLSPAANRTSEGAAEFVSLVQVEDPEQFFDRLHQSGFLSYTFDANQTNPSIYDARLPEKAIFVFGNEVSGTSGLVRALVERNLRIPGTGNVESLNVSVAAALAMAEFNRQGLQRSVRIVKNPG